MSATDPAAIVARVPGWAGRARVIGPLNGGITNENFLIDVDGARFVLRLPGDDTHLLGIDRHVEREASERAATLGLAPDVAAFVEPEGCLVTRFVAGVPLPQLALTDTRVIARVAEMLRAFHTSGPISGSFDAFAVPERQIAAARAAAVAIPDAFATVEAMVREIEVAFATSPDPWCPCHNDLLIANFLRDGDRIWLLDWEYAGMNDRLFDLANLAVNNEIGPDAEIALVAAYFGSVSERNLARLQLMKIVSDARESTWALLQQGISTIAYDYESYALMHVDRLLTTARTCDYGTALANAARPA